MREAPDVHGRDILERLETDYGLSATEIVFLPIGADLGSASFRVMEHGGDQYFLKLRRGRFHPGAVTIPHWLAGRGMKPIIPPIATRTTGALWTPLGTFTLILYPFVTGKSGWEVELSPRNWQDLGMGMSTLHGAALTPEMALDIPRETYSAVWRDRVAAFLEAVPRQTFEDPVARALAERIQERRAVIEHIVRRAEELGEILARQPPDACLCHGDLHAGNVLIDETGRLFIVDWDTLILAPKERDLMFIGGGVGGAWNREDEAEWFHEGYGRCDIHRPALAYYRCERIVQDIAEICDALLAGSIGGEDRAALLEMLSSQFEPANVVEIACAT